MNSKRTSDGSSSSSIKEKKRKHNTLTILQKVELLRKLQRGSSVKKMCDEYGCGKSTVYDIQKQKDKILSFYADSDTQLAMSERRTLKGAKNEEMDKVMIEWVRQRRSENVPLTGPLIIAQAKLFHEELKIDSPCEYSEGWLGKFKRRHGIRQLRISGEKASADVDAIENFVMEFSEMISEESITLEQIFNADETSLFWRYVPRITLATADEKNPSGVKDNKERLTILACGNAAGSFKNKLLVIGKSAKPRALKGVKVMPVIYKANKRAWITKDILTEWFRQHFLPEVQEHYRALGMNINSKTILVLDNCSAHPSAEVLNTENVKVVFLPPNCTSLVQPMDMGVLRALKCSYKSNFLKRMLLYVNNDKNIKDFLKTFSVKGALWEIAKSWGEINSETLRNAWHNLIPSTIFFEDEDTTPDFEGFRPSKEKTMVSELLNFCKSEVEKESATLSINEADVNEVLYCDDNSPVVNTLTDEEIANMALGRSQEIVSSSEEDDMDDIKEKKIPTKDLLDDIDRVIKGLEQRSFIPGHTIMSLYHAKDQLISHREKSMKQLTLTDMFQK